MADKIENELKFENKTENETEFEPVSLADIARNSIRNRKNSSKEKIKLDEIIAKYPDGVTINGANLVNSPKFDKNFWIFSFVEDDSKCFSAGGEMARIAEDWLKFYDNNFAALNDDLEKYPLKFKLNKIRTKKGFTYTAAEIIENSSHDK